MLSTRASEPHFFLSWENTVKVNFKSNEFPSREPINKTNLDDSSNAVKARRALLARWDLIGSRLAHWDLIGSRPEHRCVGSAPSVALAQVCPPSAAEMKVLD